jgi:hypothetical protein
MVTLADLAAKRRAEAAEAERRAKFVVAFTACALVLLFMPAVAFVLMLVVGAVHGIVAAVPAIGYGTTFLLLLGLNFIVATVRSLRK